MGEIRKFVEDDLSAVVGLFARVFGGTHSFPKEHVAAYFEKIFFHNPWCDQDLPSLVYREGSTITGFIGVIPRKMLLGNRPVRLAVSNHFMVDPSRRSGLAALELNRAFFNGPQDFSVAEGGASSRKIWEALGGHTSLLYSLRWTRPLRPGRYLLGQLSRRSLPKPLVWASRPWCVLLDGILPRIPRNPFYQSPQASEADVTTEEFVDAVAELSHGYFLRPDYDRVSLQWLLGVLQEKKSHGNLRKTLVRSPQGELIGSYVYYLNPGRVSEVLQVAAKAHSMPAVLDHLFYHASRRGAVGVTGRLDPRFMDDFSDRYCLLHRGDHPWLLVHSRHREILETFSHGEAFLSRMEGEWWISFPGG